MYRNPFIFQSYIAAKYFCDRENETHDLITAFENKRNMTLLAVRRLGKTGLIHHVHHKLSKNKHVVPIYLDILNTQNQQDFVNKLVNAVIKVIDQKKDSFLSKAVKQFSKYKPIISVDGLTGSPQISLDIQDDQEVRMSLEVLFHMMGKEKANFQIAIDEFQQIMEYENSNLDATIREYIQKLENIHFIFSGSVQHMMLDLFCNVKKPLYRMTGFMSLNKISKEKYQKFILRHFVQGKIKITEAQIAEILDWTKTHTFYTQYFCNMLYTIANQSVSDTDLNRVKLKILQENEITYLSYRKLMSPKQWNLLRAIGKEGVVSQPNSKEFIATHNLGAGSTVRQSLKAMLQAEMIYETLETDKTTYQVYDVFFERWLQMH